MWTFGFRCSSTLMAAWGLVPSASVRECIRSVIWAVPPEAGWAAEGAVVGCAAGAVVAPAAGVLGRLGRLRRRLRRDHRRRQRLAAGGQRGGAEGETADAQQRAAGRAD